MKQIDIFSNHIRKPVRYLQVPCNNVYDIKA